MKNSFLITSLGRTGTMFLSSVMNRSSVWEVLHEPENSGDIFLKPKDRFNKDYYGEVNCLLRDRFMDIKTKQKGVIYRDYREVLLSYMNKGKLKDSKLHRLNRSHNYLFDALSKNPSILLIDFNQMVSSCSYLKKVLYCFGITDVFISSSILSNKKNVTKINIYKEFNELPAHKKKQIRNKNWANYSNLKNWIK